MFDLNLIISGVNIIAIRNEAIKDTTKFPIFKAFRFMINLMNKIDAVNKITVIQYNLLVQLFRLSFCGRLNKAAIIIIHPIKVLACCASFQKGISVPKNEIVFLRVSI
ncbi:hypothetical protein FLGSB24_02080 [Flavobacterium sp. GSB-24]|nr:hypothetical protein FLGSB24_02080 [Flavobacterium sp. GSB-24]